MRGNLFENIKITANGPSTIINTGELLSAALPVRLFQQNAGLVLLSGAIPESGDVTIECFQSDDAEGSHVDPEPIYEQVVTGGENATSVMVDVGDAEVEDRVIINGDVFICVDEYPGDYEFEDAATLAEAINATGKYSASANGDEVTIYSAALSAPITVGIDPEYGSAWSEEVVTLTAKVEAPISINDIEEGYNYIIARITNNSGESVIAAVVALQGGATYRPV